MQGGMQGGTQGGVLSTAAGATVTTAVVTTVPHRRGLLMLVAVQLLLAGVSSVLMVFVESMGAAVCWAVLFALMIGIQDVVMMVTFAEIFGQEHIGAIMGVVTMIMTLATALGPVLGAVCVESQRLELFFVPVAVAALMLGVLCFVVGDPGEVRGTCGGGCGGGEGMGKGKGRKGRGGIEGGTWKGGDGDMVEKGGRGEEGTGEGGDVDMVEKGGEGRKGDMGSSGTRAADTAAISVSVSVSESALVLASALTSASPGDLEMSVRGAEGGGGEAMV